jgi:hypothetical protein
MALLCSPYLKAASGNVPSHARRPNCRRIPTWWSDTLPQYATIEEVAHLLTALATRGANFVGEIYTGVVVVESVARTMTWGFPLRLKTMKPTSKPKAANNARGDKLMPPIVPRNCSRPLTKPAASLVVVLSRKASPSFFLVGHAPSPRRRV